MILKNIYFFQNKANK